jgi:predicted regulator of Ras-like GTPase activity (Roadblock/LC7/MglB family)
MSDAIQQAEALVKTLRLEANAQNVAIVDGDGQVIAADLDGEFDAHEFFTELREAAEREFDVVDETGEPLHVKVEPFANGRFTLFVMYDDHSTLGLVRLNIKRTRQQFESVLGQL